MSRTKMTSESERRLVQTGWDGWSEPMYELWAPCGCAWTDDGTVRMRVCTGCLRDGRRIGEDDAG